MESSPANPMLSSNQYSIPPQSSMSQRQTPSDTDGDQYDHDEHFSLSASHHIVPYKNEKSSRGQNDAPFDASTGGLTVGAYTVQCAKCFKWRFIPTPEKYEKIRERIKEEPFVCERAREWKPDVTCDVPTDISQDNNNIWAMDIPSIMQAPKGWKRVIIVRKELSFQFADVYYISPTGKKLRSRPDVERYLREKPEHSIGANINQFSFTAPAPLRKNYVKKRPPQMRRRFGALTGSTCPPQPTLCVPPLAWAPAAPKAAVDYSLVPYNEGPNELLQGEPKLEPKLEKHEGIPMPLGVVQSDPAPGIPRDQYLDGQINLR